MAKRWSVSDIVDHGQHGLRQGLRGLKGGRVWPQLVRWLSNLSLRWLMASKLINQLCRCCCHCTNTPQNAAPHQCTARKYFNYLKWSWKIKQAMFYILTTCHIRNIYIQHGVYEPDHWYCVYDKWAHKFRKLICNIKYIWEFFLTFFLRSFSIFRNAG